MIKTIILSLLIFTCFSSTNYANDSIVSKETDDNFPKNYLGASASSISSIGISYHFLEKRKNPTDAFKLTFGLLPDLYDSEIWVFFGTEFQTELYRNDFSRLYWLIGAGYQSLYLSLGSGVGYEIYSGKPGIAINLDLGISLFKGIPNPHGDAGSRLGIAPGIGLGLSYAF